MIEILDDLNFYPEIKTVLAVDSSSVFEEKELKPVSVGNYEVAPWGTRNDLPDQILELMRKSDVMSTNVEFNRNVSFGLGPKVVRLIKNDIGKVVDYVELSEGKEWEFFERNDLSMFFLEQLTDLCHFSNAFAEMIPEAKTPEIYSLRHKEAAFSRWSMMDAKGNINFHYYSSKWADSPSASDVVASKVIDEFNAYNDVTKKMALKKERMIFPVYMPSPGRPYYSRPSWYSLFESGWYDHSVAIPALKKAIMQNNLGVKFIIYISPKYFEDIFQKESIPATDVKARKKRIDEEKTKFNDFLTGAVNANKSVMAFKELVMSGSSTKEEKWIEIEPIKNDLNGGEYITDVETAANTICYAMGVHPSLIGATPGKGSSGVSGTDKRELFLIKQSLMKPVVDRALRPINIIRQVNKWAKDVTVIIPEYIFTTLDQNKTGKQESTTNKA